MADYQTTLQKLHTNLNTLREREAKYASDTPVALLNQISDHQTAIILTEQAIADDLSEVEWHEALKPLNIDHTLIEGGFFQKILKALSLPTEQQRELRNRQIMLQRVYDFWVKGVLENSLHNEVLIELGMETKPEEVEYPWDMVIQRPDQSNRTLPPGTKMIDVFDESGGSLLILGEPGSGKTTMLLELARQTIARGQADPTQPIPVVFNLSSWAEIRLPLVEWLVEELNAKYNIPKQLAQEWIDNNELVLLLDGLDEVTEPHRTCCVEAINTFVREYLVLLGICSRLTDYEILSTKLSLRQAILLQPLTNKQIDTSLIRMGPELETLQNTLHADLILSELAQSPLILNIMTLAYRGKSVDQLQLLDPMEEGRRKHLLDAYLQQMFKRRSTYWPFPPGQTVHWLAWIAQKMSQYAQSVFLIERMQPSWLRTMVQQRLYAIGSGLINGLSGAIIVYLLLIALWLTVYFFSPSPDFSEGEVMTEPYSFGLILPLMALFSLGLSGSLTGGIFGGVVGMRQSKGTVRMLRWLGVFGLNFMLLVLCSGLILSMLIIGSILYEEEPTRAVLLLVLPFYLFVGLVGGLIGGTLTTTRIADNDIRTVEYLKWSWAGIVYFLSNVIRFGINVGSVAILFGLSLICFILFTLPVWSPLFIGLATMLVFGHRA